MPMVDWTPRGSPDGASRNADIGCRANSVSYDVAVSHLPISQDLSVGMQIL